MNVRDRLRAPGLLRRLLHEVLRFGSVGAVGFLIDVGIFNLLCFGPWPVFAENPLRAKVVSVSLATLVAWVGNRQWTFRHRRGRTARYELLLFVLFSFGGLLISVGCLWFSHYSLGLDSPFADNVSANVIGLGLATIFRFVTYRTFVFHDPGKKVQSLVH
ncbi:GtrA family protein [Pengzhenrongella phosphoraccumulans]|uniref:GtrA family protein n=1 Tax=Pengzhenrongella phosphoraccumulans TaxID=3114394 RepID=UPI00388F6C1F